jgi:signal peptidase I
VRGGSRIGIGALVVAIVLVTSGAALSGAQAAIAADQSSGPSPGPDYEQLLDAIMVPTILPGATVTFDLNAYKYALPTVGDVVLFHPPRNADRGVHGACAEQHVATAVCGTSEPRTSSRTSISRIVAGPGDVISMRNGYVIRNGKRETYPSLTKVCVRSPRYCNFPTAVRIPQNDYFVVNDNRAVLDDSRVWGPVSAKGILGKAVRVTPRGQSPFPPVRGADIVVAIVGGVLLVIVLCRPRIRWSPFVDKWTAQWLEAVVTALAFFVGGFVFSALFAILTFTPIDAAARGALWWAVGMIALYGLVVHSESFVKEDGFRPGQYASCVVGSVLLGLAAGDVATGSGDSGYFLAGSYGDLILFLLGLVVILADAAVIHADTQDLRSQAARRKRAQLPHLGDPDQAGLTSEAAPAPISALPTTQDSHGSGWQSGALLVVGGILGAVASRMLNSRSRLAQAGSRLRRR